MFARYMNIVHLEGRMTELNNLANIAQQNDQKFNYRLRMDAIKDKILKLRVRMESKAFLNGIVKKPGLKCLIESALIIDF